MKCNWLHPFMALMVEFHILDKSHTQVSCGQMETDRLRFGYNINFSLDCRLTLTITSGSVNTCMVT